jgi:hypothetical protein
MSEGPVEAVTSADRAAVLQELGPRDHDGHGDDRIALLTRLRVGDPRRGAAIITRLATDPAFATTTGRYFSVKDARTLDCPQPGRDEALQIPRYHLRLIQCAG